MSILDGIDADVAAAVADIFRETTHQFTGGMVSDGRGGQTRSKSTQTVKALVVDYKAYVRATAGIPSNERKVMVQGYGMSPTIGPDDLLVQGDEAWQVIEVSKDPANAVYTCRCRPVAVPSGIVPVLLLASAEAQGGVFSGLSFDIALDLCAGAVARSSASFSVGFGLDAPAVGVAHPSASVEIGVHVGASASTTAVVDSGIALFTGLAVNAAALAISESGSGLVLSVPIFGVADSVAQSGSGLNRGFGLAASSLAVAASQAGIDVAAASGGVFVDNFDRADEALENSPDWDFETDEHGGTAAVVSNQLSFGGGSGLSYRFNPIDVADHAVKATIKSGTSQFAFILCASMSADQASYIALRARGSYYQIVTQGFSEIARHTVAPAVDDEVELRCSGSDVSFWLNGVEVIPATSMGGSYATNTGVGFEPRFAEVIIDNFEARAL
jgi:hypothetical protein